MDLQVTCIKVTAGRVDYDGKFLVELELESSEAEIVLNQIKDQKGLDFLRRYLKEFDD